MYFDESLKCAAFVVLLEIILPFSTQVNCPTFQERDGIFGQIRWSTYSNDVALNTIVGISLLTCVKECQLRSHCEAVVFQRLFLLCRLYDVRNSSSPVSETKAGSLYVNMNVVAVDQLHLGACRSRDCPAGSRCHDISGQKICQPSECPKPPNVANSDLRIMSRAIGSRARYLCRDGYKYLGKSVIKCEQNLTWTESSFQCVEFQRLANMNVEVATVRTAMDYFSAKEYCAQFEGGRLIKIDSETKNTAVSDILAGERGDYFIDGHYNPATNSWTYFDGDIVLDCCWRLGEPNYLSFEHCIAKMYYFGYNEWINIPCALHKQSICEVEKL